MVSRLFVDMLRRTPVRYLAFLGIGACRRVGFHCFHGAGLDRRRRSRSSLTYVLGPVVMLERLQTPLIPYLPVSRRDVWRATWLMSTLAPAALMAAVKLPAMLTADAPLVEADAVDDDGPALRRRRMRTGRRRSTRTRGTPVVARSPLWLLIAGLVWPIVVYASLPTAVAERRPAQLRVLRHRSRAHDLERLSHADDVRHGALRPRAASSTAVVRSGPRDRLSGLPRLVAHELGSSLAVGANVMCVFVGMAFVIESWTGPTSRPSTTFWSTQALLLFDPHGIQAGPPRTRADAAVRLVAASTPRPSSSGFRSCSGTSGAAAGHGSASDAAPRVAGSRVERSCGSSLACVHRMTVGPSPIAGYHLPMLFTCIGVSALGIAVGLRFTATVVQASTLLFPFVRMLDTSRRLADVDRRAGVRPAAALNVSALSRSATYKRRDLLLPRAQAYDAGDAPPHRRSRAPHEPVGWCCSSPPSPAGCGGRPAYSASRHARSRRRWQSPSSSARCMTLLMIPRPLWYCRSRAATCGARAGYSRRLA